MNELYQCESCRRHVAAEEARCPFCGSVLTPRCPARFDPSRLEPARFDPRIGRITRAVLFWGAGALSACSPETTTDPSPGAESTESLTATPEATSEAPVAMEPVPDESVGLVDPTPSEPEAYAVGPVELEPEPADIARRERAHAEARKEQQRQLALRRQRQRWRQQMNRLNNQRIAPPYGAPPGDSSLV